MHKIFRSIRLESLERNPEAFQSSHDAEASKGLEFFAERLDGSTVFGGFENTELLGVAGFRRLEQTKVSHKGFLWGMYVRKKALGTGLATSIVDRLLDHARQHVELVQLGVAASNERAVRFYERCGFEPYGVEPRALKINSHYIDEVLMCRFLG